MSILARYACGRLALHVLLFVLGLSTLALALDLMDEADRVLNATDGDVAAVAIYGALRLPDIAARMLPVSALLGAVLTLGQLMRNNELVAIWGSGVSALGLMKALVPAALALGALTYVNSDVLVPNTIRTLYAANFGLQRKTAFFAGETSALWLVSGPDIVRMPRNVKPGEPLTDISIFRRDASGALIEWIDAARAEAEGEGWRLTNVVRRNVATASSEALPTLFWPGRIDVDALPLLSSSMRELSTGQMMQLIDNQGYGQRPTGQFRTWFNARIASAVVPGLMIFLVVSVAQRFGRTGAFATLFASSLAIGFAYSAFDGVCLTLGESALLPPWFAAWGPKLVLAALVGTFVIAREG